MSIIFIKSAHPISSSVSFGERGVTCHSTISGNGGILITANAPRSSGKRNRNGSASFAGEALFGAAVVGLRGMQHKKQKELMIWNGRRRSPRAS
jgi:hypothetical protein